MIFLVMIFLLKNFFDLLATSRRGVFTGVLVYTILMVFLLILDLPGRDVLCEPAGIPEVETSRSIQSFSSSQPEDISGIGPKMKSFFTLSHLSYLIFGLALSGLAVAIVKSGVSFNSAGNPDAAAQAAQQAAQAATVMQAAVRERLQNTRLQVEQVTGDIARINEALQNQDKEALRGEHPSLQFIESVEPHLRDLQESIETMLQSFDLLWSQMAGHGDLLPWVMSGQVAMLGALVTTINTVVAKFPLLSPGIPSVSADGLPSVSPDGPIPPSRPTTSSDGTKPSSGRTTSSYDNVTEGDAQRAPDEIPLFSDDPALVACYKEVFTSFFENKALTDIVSKGKMNLSDAQVLRKELKNKPALTTLRAEHSDAQVGAIASNFAGFLKHLRANQPDTPLEQAWESYQASSLEWQNRGARHA